MKQILSFIVLLPLAVLGQQGTQHGVTWFSSMNWDQVKEQARASGKYIFVDCYATWCKPCKEMDANIYTAEPVAKLINQQFMPIKIQIDKAEGDNSSIREWYTEAEKICTDYKVFAVPTFLFFSPEGEIIHRGIGFKDVPAFLKLVQESLDPSSQFYTLVKKWRQQSEKCTDAELRTIAVTSLGFGEKKLADSVALAFKSRFFDKMRDEELLQEDNLTFISNFSYLINSSDPFFKLMYKNGKKVNENILKIGGTTGNYSRSSVKEIIAKEEFYNVIWKDNQLITNHPDWDKLFSRIANKYDADLANEIVLDAKLNFFKQSRDWQNYVQVLQKKIDNTPLDSKEDFGYTWMLNSKAWDIFQNCENKKVLKEALNWSKRSIDLETNPDMYVQYYDTYANLLYKLGRVKEAVDYEERAFFLEMRNGERKGNEKSSELETYRGNLQKMRARERTWMHSD